MSLRSKLLAIANAVADEADRNPEFAEQINLALGWVSAQAKPKRRRGRRRDAPVLDPFEVYEEGEVALRNALAQLEVEQLKDIVAHHGMDLQKLAMRWKTAGRLIDLIVERVVERSEKGSAFMG